MTTVDTPRILNNRYELVENLGKGGMAMVYLARNKEEGFISIETIARAQGIPPKFLEQLMLALKRAHFLRSTKGQHGGYALSKEPNQITLAEIIRLFDGALAPTESVSEGDGTLYVIDQNTCVECVGHFDSPRCAAACPVECIVKA